VKDVFEARCPGVSLMLEARTQEDTSPGWEESEKLVKRWKSSAQGRTVMLKRHQEGQEGTGK